jgi:crotonobetainyl-CoA:carnitine CoA-transferase CaiB-like acyl-CoA transferase
VVLRRPGPLVVVDLSSLWAGPLCAHLLGLAGATVVKVEAADRLDGARHGPGAFYDYLHTGHQSVVLDVHTIDGRAFLHRLCETADVVITSARPRAIAGLGIDPIEMLRAQTISAWVSITGFGPDQPDRIGFGDDAAVAGGLLTWADGQPSYMGDAIADPLTGLAAAETVLRALTTRQATHIEADLAGTAAAVAAASTPTDESMRTEGTGEFGVAFHHLMTPELSGQNPAAPAAPAAAPGAHTELWWRRCASS